MISFIVGPQLKGMLNELSREIWTTPRELASLSPKESTDTFV